MTKRVPLPPPVAHIYKAVAALEALYPRKFTPDGHLVGSIGEVVAAEALGLTLYRISRPGHDAYDANGDVQIKMTAGSKVAMYETCNPARRASYRITGRSGDCLRRSWSACMGESGQAEEERTARD
jgi:hypothetical protein